MAAGSSTPEFFASMIGVFLTKDDVGVGTIVGSAVFNILVIIGLSAALAGGDLRLDWRPLLRDSVFYVVSILLLFTFTMGSSNGKIDWWEGFILVSTYVVYVLFMAFVNRIYMEKALKLGWFGIVAPDIETGGNNNNESDNNIINNNNNDGDGMMTSVFDGNDGEDDGGQMQQPSLHAFSQSALISMSEDGRKRYRDLNPRTRLRGAQIAVMATIRLASTSSSGTNGDDIDAAVLPSAKRSTTSADPNKPGRHSPNTTGGGMSPSPHDDDGNNNSSPAGNTGDHDGDEGPTLLGIELPRTMFGKIFFPFSLIWKLAFRYTILDCSQDSKRKLWPVTFILSIIWISAISYVMVEASRISGCLLNIPATLMGLTVLAAGTSVPDALASISVARDGAGDMAVSNAIGSNVFDILLGLGFPWMLGSWILSDDIVVDTEHITSVVIPIIILFVIMIAFVGLLIAFKWTMNKWFGYSLFGLYFVFVAYTLLENYVFKFGGSR